MLSGHSKRSNYKTSQACIPAGNSHANWNRENDIELTWVLQTVSPIYSSGWCGKTCVAPAPTKNTIQGRQAIHEHAQSNGTSILRICITILGPQFRWTQADPTVRPMAPHKLGNSTTGLTCQKRLQPFALYLLRRRWRTGGVIVIFKPHRGLPMRVVHYSSLMQSHFYKSTAWSWKNSDETIWWMNFSRKIANLWNKLPGRCVMIGGHSSVDGATDFHSTAVFPEKPTPFQVSKIDSI